MLQRFVGSPRVYSWLIAIGVVVAVMPLPITLLTHSKAAYHEAQIEQTAQQIEWLRAAISTAVTPADSAGIEAQIARIEEISAVARRRLDRQRRRLETMWRATGGGPLLVVVGVLIAFLGYRLRRFELYG